MGREFIFREKEDNTFEQYALLIRCKDCEFWHKRGPEHGFCEHSYGYKHQDGFCDRAKESKGIDTKDAIEVVLNSFEKAKEEAVKAIMEILEKDNDWQQTNIKAKMKTLRQIANESGLSKQAIRKRAQKAGVLDQLHRKDGVLYADSDQEKKIQECGRHD